MLEWLVKNNFKFDTSFNDEGITYILECNDIEIGRLSFDRNDIIENYRIRESYEFASQFLRAKKLNELGL